MELSGPSPGPDPTPGVLFTSVRWSLIIAFSFSSALRGFQLVPWGVNPAAHNPTCSRVAEGCVGASAVPAKASVQLSLCSLLLSPPSQPIPSIPGNPPPEMFAVKFMNIWNILPGCKTTYLDSAIA